MRCDRARTLYDEYSGAHLPLATAARVEEHLAGCPGCREYFEQHDLIARSLRSAAAATQPGGEYFSCLNARVLAELDQPLPRGEEKLERAAIASTARLRRPLWWGAGLAAAGLLALAVGPLLSSSDDPFANANRPASGAPLLATNGETNRGGFPAQTVIVNAPPPLIQRSDVNTAFQFAQRFFSNPPTAVAANLRHTNPNVDAAIARNDALSANAYGAGDNADALGLDSADAIRTVSYGKSVRAPHASFSDQISVKLRLAYAQLPVTGNDGLLPQLRDVSTLLDHHGDAGAELRSVSAVRVPLLYLEAQNDLAAGQPLPACTALEGILINDPTSPLAVRAHLQLGDLFFNQFGDFHGAEGNYRACLGKAGAAALTRPERAQVDRQLKLLDTFRDSDFEPLHLSYLIRTAPWAQATAALQRLTEIQNAEQLWPESAQALENRLATPSQASPDISRRVYNLVEKQAALTQNGAVRAWLDLSLGDLAQSQFQDTRRAGELYRQAAVAAAADTDVTAAAHAKLADLDHRQLLDVAR